MKRLSGRLFLYTMDMDIDPQYMKKSRTTQGLLRNDVQMEMDIASRYSKKSRITQDQRKIRVGETYTNFMGKYYSGETHIPENYRPNLSSFMAVVGKEMLKLQSDENASPTTSPDCTSDASSPKSLLSDIEQDKASTRIINRRRRKKSGPSICLVKPLSVFRNILDSDGTTVWLCDYASSCKSEEDISTDIALKGITLNESKTYRVQVKSFESGNKNFSRNTRNLYDAIWIYEIALLISDRPNIIASQLHSGNFISLRALGMYGFLFTPFDFFIEFIRQLKVFADTELYFTRDMLSKACECFDTMNMKTDYYASSGSSSSSSSSTADLSMDTGNEIENKANCKRMVHMVYKHYNISPVTDPNRRLPDTPAKVYETLGNLFSQEKSFVDKCYTVKDLVFKDRENFTNIFKKSGAQRTPLIYLK